MINAIDYKFEFELNDIRRWARCNQELYDDNVITKSQYVENKTVIAERYIKALMESLKEENL